MRCRRPVPTPTAMPPSPPSSHAPADPAAAPPWHAQTAEQVLQAQASGLHGLGAEEAVRRLSAHGPNRLAEARQAGPLERLLRQFNNLLLYVLMAAAAVTALMGHWVDTAVIAAVVILNAVIGFVQEGKAEKALQAIRHLLAPRAVVLRDGRQHEIDAADLVPGDVVLLASGDSLPADVRLLQARNLRIDEAALTGESVPVDKQVEPVAAAAAIGDRRCMGYAGTLVTQGSVEGVAPVVSPNTGQLRSVARFVRS